MYTVIIKLQNIIIRLFKINKKQYLILNTSKKEKKVINNKEAKELKEKIIKTGMRLIKKYASEKEYKYYKKVLNREKLYIKLKK